MTKLIYLIPILTLLNGCASVQPEDVRPNYGGALSELYRRQDVSQSPYRAYDQRSSHTCTSYPVLSNGYVIRTDVRCK